MKTSLPEMKIFSLTLNCVQKRKKREEENRQEKERMEKSKSGRDDEFKYLLIILYMAIFISHLFPETEGNDNVCDL